MHIGDESYAEIDAIQARQAQERAQRFGLVGARAGERRREEEEETTFCPEAAQSSGGLLDLDWGSRGCQRWWLQSGRIAPEAKLAQMY